MADQAAKIIIEGSNEKENKYVPLQYNMGMVAFSKRGSVIQQLFNVGESEGSVSDNHKFFVPYDGCTFLQTPVFFYDDKIKDGDLLAPTTVYDESDVQYVKKEHPDAYFSYIGKIGVKIPASSKKLDQFQVIYILKNDGIEVRTINIPSGEENVAFTPFEARNKMAK